MSIRSRLDTLLRDAPEDADAVEFEERWVTWGQLRATAHGLDEQFAHLPVGARIGVVLENRPEHIAAVAWILATGRCVVTLSPLQPAQRLIADFTASGLTTVVATPHALSAEAVRAAMTSTAQVVELQPSGIVRQASASALAGVTRAGVAVEMLTSGTTGPPKRVLLTDRQMDTALVSSGHAPRAGASLSPRTTIVATPLVHIGGFWGVLASLSAGRRIALLPRFSLAPWLRAVERHQPRAVGLVPAALRTVLDADVPRERLSSVQAVTCGTAPCPPELADAFFRRYGARVLMTYGATEFAGAVAGWTFALHKRWWDTKGGSTGRAFPGVDLRITDSKGEPLPVGTDGHLEIRTAQSPGDPNEWVRTSDLGYLDEDGFLWIKGRADDAIIRGGFKVHPEVVRHILEKHPFVREAAVAGLPDERLGAVPVAVVERHPGGGSPDVDELLRLCREHLTPYEVPVHVVVVDELPRTPSTKVSRVEMLELVTASLATGAA